MKKPDYFMTMGQFYFSPSPLQQIMKKISNFLSIKHFIKVKCNFGSLKKGVFQIQIENFEQF